MRYTCIWITLEKCTVALAYKVSYENESYKNRLQPSCSLFTEAVMF